MGSSTGTVEWDALGRLAGRVSKADGLSWRYEYDEKDQMIVATRSDGLRVDYAYDTLGRRVAETCEGRTTFFGWDHDSTVEEDAPGQAPTRRVFAGDGYTLLLESTHSAAFRMVA